MLVVIWLVLRKVDAIRKLVINDWVHVSCGLVLEDIRWMVKLDIPVWGDLLGGRFKCGKIM